MTTLDRLSTAHPDHGEVADAALAMADFDAKSGNHAMALDWLGVAAQHRELTREYRNKKAIWENGSASDATTDAHRDAVAAAALSLIRRVLVEGARLTREALEREASVHLAVPRADAMRTLDAVAQRLGVSALTT
jgi:LmbE family N-acetylglucosaminyl deacetylase